MALSKEEIKKNIVDQLFWDARVDASSITVEFTDGTVKLALFLHFWPGSSRGGCVLFRSFFCKTTSK